ncbi:hypothetical protein Spiaf_2114 [Spirochaeta africana DSM 8902]|uniref:Uncharacterized protein n=1 Tax=Spirochaeta africana (strain ATCC 700263 / DSM 8902 / Z-7692) TaxID=889378 RepID=H9UKW9_SPIAZ|nr:hypothetical protein Spiaf_2114 [Spirochaeta africana DSM 8902]
MHMHPPILTTHFPLRPHHEYLVETPKTDSLYRDSLLRSWQYLPYRFLAAQNLYRTRMTAAVDIL